MRSIRTQSNELHDYTALSHLFQTQLDFNLMQNCKIQGEGMTKCPGINEGHINLVTTLPSINF